MSKFSDLLNRDKEYADKMETKVNPFAALNKSVAKAANPPGGVATSAEGVTGNPDKPEKPSSAPFSFLGKKKEPSTVSASLSVEEKTTPDITMEGISGVSFSETQSAKEFQSEDQPDTYSKELVDRLKDSLNILTNSIDNKELVGDALKQIMLSLKRYPFLADIMHPEDCQLMVRGLRENYGVTLAKKQVRGQKREASSKDVGDVLDMLSDMDMQI